MSVPQRRNWRVELQNKAPEAREQEIPEREQRGGKQVQLSEASAELHRHFESCLRDTTHAFMEALRCRPSAHSLAHSHTCAHTLMALHGVSKTGHAVSKRASRDPLHVNPHLPPFPQTHTTEWQRRDKRQTQRRWHACAMITRGN